MRESQISTTRGRVEWVDSAKSISIILVVVYHIKNAFHIFSIESDSLNKFVDISTNLRMPLFFAAAGLFAAKWIHVSWVSFFNKKAALLIWVFLIWQPSILLYNLMNSWALGSLSWDIFAQEFIRILVTPLRPNGELWFLWTLLIFFIIARITRSINFRVQIIASTMISVLWMAVVEVKLPEIIFRAIGSGWTGLFRYYFLFIGFALLSTRIRRSVASWKWYQSALVFFLWFGVATGVSYLDSSYGLYLFVLSVLGVWGGIGLAKLISSIRLLRYIGRNTLPIYLAHSLLISTSLLIIYLMGILDWVRINPWLACFAISIIVISISLIFYRCNSSSFLYRQPKWFSIQWNNE